MSISAFGVDHGGEIAKANYTAPNKDEFRSGVGSQVNPRSKTYVKRGTSMKRAGRAVKGEVKGIGAGGAGGAVAGGLIGLARKPGMGRMGALVGGSYGSGIGVGIGANKGREANIKSGDTVAFHRRTGKKAQGKHSIGPMAGMHRYGNTPVNNLT
jgi:hypothetical protein